MVVRQRMGRCPRGRDRSSGDLSSGDLSDGRPTPNCSLNRHLDSSRWAGERHTGISLAGERHTGAGLAEERRTIGLRGEWPT